MSKHQIALRLSRLTVRKLLRSNWAEKAEPYREQILDLALRG